MNSRLRTFRQYVTAVDALRNCFSDQQEALAKGEVLDQYGFSTKVAGVAWLRSELPPLAGSLLPSRFVLRLTVTVYDFQAELQIHGDASHLEVSCESAGHFDGEPLGAQPTTAAFPTFQDTCNTVWADKNRLPIKDIYVLLNNLVAGGATVDLSLAISLTKERVNEKLVRGVNQDERPKVTSFLFPEALLVILKRISLARFEEEFCEKRRRTVIPIFGFSGCLSSDTLAICGRGHEDKLDVFLTKPLSDRVLQKVKKTLELRKSQSLWLFPTTWLTPDTFAVTVDHAGTGEKLARQLKSFQALLSAIFLADSVEFREEEDRFWVEYKGFGRVRLPVNRVLLLEQEPHLEALYQLYAYAYEGFSPDKLEIAQQFLSLIAVDLKALCEKATDVRDATSKTYARALVEKVKDYFDARHKIQERIKTAIAETSKSVIGLSRDVSADLYKIAGVIVGAVAGALLKPDLSLWAALGASLVIAVYMGLVIFYHLPTLKQAYDLRMAQHVAYVESFKEVLREVEIQTFIEDKDLDKTEVMFNEKCGWATKIYVAFLIASLVVAAISIYLLLRSSLHPGGSEGTMLLGSWLC